MTLSVRFSEYDRSPDALLIMRDATSAGVTKETVGELMNLAIRYGRLGCVKEAAELAQRALEINERWGRLHESYSMPDGVVTRAREIVAAGC